MRMILLVSEMDEKRGGGRRESEVLMDCSDVGVGSGALPYRDC